MVGYDILVDILRDEEPVGEHIFRFEPMQRAWEVRQITRYHRHAEASSSCILIVRPEGYVSVDLRMRRGDMRLSLQMNVDNAEIVVEGERGTWREPITDRPFLLDGPAPIFDCINTVLLLGICDGELLELPVYLLDPESGRLLRRTYRFSRRKGVIAITKGLDPLGDTLLLIDDESNFVSSCHAGGYRYQFRDSSAE